MEDGQAPGAIETVEASTTETPGVPVVTEGASGAAEGDKPEVREDVSGLKRKNAELLAKLKTFQDEKAKREQAEAVAAGDLQKVIDQLAAENAALKGGHEQWSAYLESERADLESMRSKLNKGDQSFVPDPATLATLDDVKRARGLVQRLLGESKKPTEKAPLQNAAPTVTAPTGSTVKTFAEMTPAERVEAEAKRMNGKGAASYLLPRF